MSRASVLKTFHINDCGETNTPYTQSVHINGDENDAQFSSTRLVHEHQHVMTKSEDRTLLNASGSLWAKYGVSVFKSAIHGTSENPLFTRY